MTGVSRFGELNPTWKYVQSLLLVQCIYLPSVLPLFCAHVYFDSYSKVEGLEPACEELLQFTFLLISSDDLPYYKNSHVVLERVEGFSRLALDRRGFPPLKIVLKDKIVILVNKNVSGTIY